MKQKFLPFDIVKTIDGDIGFIVDSSFNKSQIDPKHQFRYSIEFLSENHKTKKNAWFDDSELEFQGKNFLEILSEKIGNTFCHNNVSISLNGQRRG